jgi:hypothetical protein
MQVVSTTELLWLTWTVFMTALFWLPYILNRIVERGVGPALWDPQGHTRLVPTGRNVCSAPTPMRWKTW